MRRYFLPLILGSMFIGAGIILSIFEFSFFSYYNYLPENGYEKKQEYSFYSITDKDFYINVRNNNYTLIYDNNLSDQVKVTLYYYPDFIALHKTESEGFNYKELGIRFNYAHNDANAYNTMLSLLANDLKHREVHNYSLFFRPSIEVRVNPTKLNKIKILKY